GQRLGKLRMDGARPRWREGELQTLRRSSIDRNQDDFRRWRRPPAQCKERSEPVAFLHIAAEQSEKDQPCRGGEEPDPCPALPRPFASEVFKSCGTEHVSGPKKPMPGARRASTPARRCRSGSW